jgi:hypothetical protein
MLTLLMNAEGCVADISDVSILKGYVAPNGTPCFTLHMKTLMSWHRAHSYTTSIFIWAIGFCGPVNRDQQFCDTCRLHFQWRCTQQDHLNTGISLQPHIPGDHTRNISYRINITTDRAVRRWLLSPGSSLGFVVDKAALRQVFSPFHRLLHTHHRIIVYHAALA